MNRQVYIKCDQIARMIVKGMPKTRIAIEMGMSYDGLVRITRCPEYLTIEEDVRNAVVGKMDARLAKRASMETEVEDTVPEALRVLIDHVNKKRDLRAALEVLDRDPQRQFAKNATTKPVNPLTAGTPINGDVLSQAVKDADITHTLLQNAKPQTSTDVVPPTVPVVAEA